MHPLADIATKTLVPVLTSAHELLGTVPGYQPHFDLTTAASKGSSTKALRETSRSGSRDLAV